MKILRGNLKALTKIIMKNTIIVLCLIFVASPVFSQKKSYDLQRLLKEKKLTAYRGDIVAITDGSRNGISMTGLAFLQDVTFSTGTIDVDLRGKDVLQKSFIGIAFHSVDTITTDIIYFRPFNFRSADPVRRIHAVQYVSEPEYPWDKLREEHNGVYEKGIDPPPAATDWFGPGRATGGVLLVLILTLALSLARPLLTVSVTT